MNFNLLVHNIFKYFIYKLLPYQGSRDFTLVARLLVPYLSWSAHLACSSCSAILSWKKRTNINTRSVHILCFFIIMTFEWNICWVFVLYIQLFVTGAIFVVSGNGWHSKQCSCQCLIQGQGAGSVIDSELFCDWPFWWSTAVTDTPNHAQV